MSRAEPAGADAGKSGDVGFSANLGSAPLLISEFAAAASEYVMLFAQAGAAVTPIVLLGLRAHENVYLEQHGEWAARYVPAYVRQSRNRTHEVAVQHTRAFCEVLQDLRLLKPLQLQAALPGGDVVSLSGILAVDRERLRALPPAKLSALAATDALEMIYLHLFSLRNVPHLQARTAAHVAASNARPLKQGRSTSEADTRRAAFESPYDLDFVFDECGFEWVPEYIDRKRLFNVSYDLHDAQIKLYVLSHDGDFMYKISRTGITHQYDAVARGADPTRLSRFLGVDLDYTDLLLDTVEDDVYYVLTEDATPAGLLTFLEALRVKLGVGEDRLLQRINRINRRQFPNLAQGCSGKAVSLVKVPFLEPGCKIYARPFLTGHGYDLEPAAVAFLTRLYRRPRHELTPYLRHLWVAAELTSDRIVISTQHHSLVHRP